MAALLALFIAGSVGAADYTFYGSDTTIGANTGGGISNNWLNNNLPFLTAGWSWTNWDATATDASNWTAVFSGTAGTVNVNTNSDSSVYVGGLRFTVADYTLSGGTLNLVGTGTTPATITASTGNTTISSVLAGTTGMTKAGSGQLTLSGNNTYTGTTTINGGTLVLNRNGGTLANTSDVDVAGRSTLQLNYGDTVRNVTLTDGTINGSTLTASSVELNSGTVNAALGGTGIAVTKTTSGTVTLTAENTFSGTVLVNGGKLVLAHEAYPGALSNDGVSVNVNGGTLGLTYNETVNGFTLTSGSVTNESATAARLTSNTRFDLRSGTIDPYLNGTNGLTKSTSGTVTLNGANTYTGTTLVNGGTLRIGSTGSLVAGSDVTVASGAMLSNAGTVASSVTIKSGGTVFNNGGAIGNRVDVSGMLYGTGTVGAVTLNAGGIIGAGTNGTIGTLNTGALTWNAGGTYSFDFGSSGNSDLLNINGGLKLLGSGTFNLLLNSSTFDGKTDGQWLLLDTTTGITGFNPANWAINGSSLADYTGLFSVALNPTDGSALMLTYTAVPEPQTYALFFGLGTFGLIVFRRFRAKRA